GSGITGFALGLWVVGRGHSVAPVLRTVVLTGIGLLVAPFAGAIVDRYSRRATLLLCTLGLALCSLVPLFLLKEGALAVWPLYAIAPVEAVLNICQELAMVVAIPMLVAKRHFVRVNGIFAMGGVAAAAAPLLASLLLAGGGWNLLLLVEFATSFAALASLLVVTIPHPPRSYEVHTDTHSPWTGAGVGC